MPDLPKKEKVTLIIKCKIYTCKANLCVGRMRLWSRYSCSSVIGSDLAY